MSEATKLLVPSEHEARLRDRAAERGQAVELVPFDRGRLGPWPGVEVLYWAYPSPVRKDALAAAPDVAWVHSASAGVDGILPHLADRPNVLLTESGEAYGPPIGEVILGLILHAAKRFGTFHDRQRAHKWKGERLAELLGRTVGIVGLGPIGRAAAARCRACGMHVLGLRRSARTTPEVDETLGPDGLPRLLVESDYVVLACPLTDETRGLLGAAALARLRPTAVVVNIGRGALIDTAALVEALEAGRLGGACLDVTDPEPLPADHALWDAPNCFITPHVAGGGDPALFARLTDRFLENVRRYGCGEPLLGLVDRERGY